MLFIPVNLSISNGQKPDSHSPAYVYVAGGTCLFSPFWQAKKKLKLCGNIIVLWEGMHLQVHIISGKRAVFFNWLEKSPIRLLEDKAEMLGKFRMILY